MARWTGTWLQGPGASLGEVRNPGSWPGRRLGLPQHGSGSAAPFGARAGAFVLDVIASALVASLLNAFLDPSDRQRQLASYLVLALEHVVLVALTGQTVGMRVLGLTVVRIDRPDRLPGSLPAVLRTSILLLSLGLAALFSRAGRGLHDVAAGTAVVRS